MIIAIVVSANRLKNASVKIANVPVRNVIATVKSRLEVLTDLLEFYNSRLQAGSNKTSWASPDRWLKDIAKMRDILREYCPGYIEEFDNDRKKTREYRAKLLDRFTDR